LLPILKEAYELYAQLIDKREEAEIKVKKIQKAKEAMRETMK